MAQFFVTAEQLAGEMICLSGEQAIHAKVLRLKAGETVTLCDGVTQECVCVVDSVNDGDYLMRVLERKSISTEPDVKASVYMAFSKGDKLEHVIQKATELGAYEIVTFPSARCISRPDEKSLRNKLERWQKIAVSAAEQSGRGLIPQVVYVNSYKEALKRGAAADKAILFYENEHATTLKMALTEADFTTVSLLTGPEGGLEEKEVAEAREAGFDICTLGRRILRCETAPLCALSVLMYATGEF